MKEEEENCTHLWQERERETKGKHEWMNIKWKRVGILLPNTVVCRCGLNFYLVFLVVIRVACTLQYFYVEVHLLNGNLLQMDVFMPPVIPF